MLKKLLGIILILTSFYTFASSENTSLTLYITREGVKIPSEFKASTSKINELQSTNPNSMQLLLIKGIGNQIHHCLKDKNIKLSEISDNPSLIIEFSEKIPNKIKYFIEDTLSCDIFSSEGPFQIIKPKSMLNLWAKLGTGEKYYINENTVVDLNKYLNVIEKSGVKLFSHESSESLQKEEKKKLKKDIFDIFDKQQFSTNINVQALREKFVNSVNKALGLMNIKNRLEDLKKREAKLKEDYGLKNDEEKKKLDARIAEMQASIEKITKEIEDRKKEQEEKERIEKEKLAEKQRKDELENELPNLINSFLSLSIELNILSDMAVGIKSDGSSSKNEDPSTTKKAKENKISELEGKKIDSMAKDLPQFGFILGRLKMKYASPEDFAEAYVKLEEWTKGREFVFPEIENEYKKAKEYILNLYNQRQLSTTGSSKEFNHSLQKLVKDIMCKKNLIPEEECKPKKMNKPKGPAKNKPTMKFKTIG